MSLYYTYYKRPQPSCRRGTSRSDSRWWPQLLAFAASDILVGGAEEFQELKQVKYVESAVAGQVAGAHGALGRQLLVDRQLLRPDNVSSCEQ